MKLQITHDTHYDYQPQVETAQHMAHLRPRNTAVQELLAHALHISPAPDQLSETVDLYGNTRTFFSLQSPHQELQVRALSMVQTQPPLNLPATLQRTSWEQVRESFRYQAPHPGGVAAPPDTPLNTSPEASSYFNPTEFSFASPASPRHPNFVDYAHTSFAPGRDLLAAAIELMERIHTEFVYQAQSTNVDTSALDALAQRKGVCQDFAHILIACLRSLGLAARYVSGYLLTFPPPGQMKLIGSDASHAWASVYIPATPTAPTAPTGLWCDMDPTNNRWGFGSPGEDYVTLAIGRDYFDVSPMRGMIHGGSRHVLSVGVTVQQVV